MIWVWYYSLNKKLNVVLLTNRIAVAFEKYEHMLLAIDGLTVWIVLSCVCFVIVALFTVDATLVHSYKFVFLESMHFYSLTLDIRVA